MPQSILRRPTAPYGAYGACGADFFFSFSRPHPEKKAGGGGFSVAWDGTHFAARSGCRRGWRCPQKARGDLLRALVCPGPADRPGRLCKHETVDPKVATALPQPTEAGGVSADTGMPSGGCRLLARPAGLAIVELSRAADARHASDVGDCDGECRYARPSMFLITLSYGAPKHLEAPYGALRRLRRLRRRFIVFLFSATPPKKATLQYPSAQPPR